MSIRKYLQSSFLAEVSFKGIEVIYRLYSIPVLIAIYGRIAFGSISIVLGLNVVMFLFDNGLRSSGIKKLTLAAQNGRSKEVVKDVFNISIIYLIFGIINSLLIVLLFFSPYFDHLNSNSDIVLMVVVLAVTTPLSWSLSTVDQLLIAEKSIIRLNFYRLGTLMLNTVLIIMLHFFEIKLVQYFFLLNLITILVGFIKLRLELNGIEKPIRLFDKKVVFDILRETLGILFLISIYMVASKSRMLILSLQNDAESLSADFRILEVVMGTSVLIVSSMTTIMFPLIVEDRHTHHFKRILNYSFIIAAIVALGYSSFTLPFLRWWLGGDYAYLHNVIVWWSLSLLIVVAKSPMNAYVIVSVKRKILYVISLLSLLPIAYVSFLMSDSKTIEDVVIGYLAYQVVITLLEVAFIYDFLPFRSKIGFILRLSMTGLILWCIFI